MKHFMSIIVCMILQISCLNGFSQPPQSISISGNWNFNLCLQNLGTKESWAAKILADAITLSGATGEVNYGKKTIGSNYGILTRAYKYAGPAWYQREIIIPKEFGDSEFELQLERVLWESKVWVDNKYCDKQDGLGLPHFFIGDKGHTYSEYTQSIWNGIVYKIELKPIQRIHVSKIKTWPNIEKNELQITFDIENAVKMSDISYRFTLIDLSTGKKIMEELRTGKCERGKSRYDTNFKFDKPIQKWDEFNPHPYRLIVESKSAKFSEANKVEFGFRKVSTSKTKILINNQPVFMRGNLDCVHFPRIGYLSCDPAEWERIFKNYKEYGLNQVRFHSWCPPNAAFTAADRLGIYPQQCKRKSEI